MFGIGVPELIVIFLIFIPIGVLILMAHYLGEKHRKKYSRQKSTDTVKNTSNLIKIKK